MAAAQQHCFYPSGDLIVQDVPCFPDLDVSPCCGDSGRCLPNGLCSNTATNETDRATCTDRSWSSPNCPQYCLKNAYDGPGGKNFSIRHPRIWQCSNNPAAQGGVMCCDVAELDVDYRERSCCPDVGAINLFSMGSELGSPVTSITPPSSSSSSQPTLSSPTSSSATSTPSNQNSSGGNGATIAIATSTSVGALILIIAAFFLYQHRRRIRRESEAKNDRVEKGVEKDVDVRKVPYLELSGLQAIEIQGFQASELSTNSKDQRTELPG